MLFFVLILEVSAFCATNTIEIQAKGQGGNRDEAISNALIGSIAQANGAQINTGKVDYGLVQADVKGFDNNQTIVVLDSAPGETNEKVKVSGFIKTYEILDEKKIDDGTYEVTLKALVYDYQPPDRNNRYNFEVMPVQALERNYYFDGTIISASDLSKRLCHKISMALTKTNKFAVLSEDFDRDELFNPNGVNIREKAKADKSLNADYILTGVLSDVNLKGEDKYLRAIDRTVREYELNLVFDYKVIVAPTKQIVFSDTVRYRLETDEVKKLTTKSDLGELNITELVDNLLTKLSNDVVSKVVDRIYPTRIAVINKNGKVIINQGGDRIKEGMMLYVIKEGDEIIDYDTKESLGKIETVVAKIKIIQVKSNFAYAEIVEGQNQVKEGLICRISEAKQSKVQGRQSEVIFDSHKGVKLPIDQ
jgi:hypothetical protein